MIYASRKIFINILIFIIVFCSGISKYSFGQEIVGAQYAVSASPLYLINNGLRLDFEKRLSKHNQWFGIAPQVYLDIYGDEKNNTTESENYNNGLINRNYETMSGFGIDAYHKIFLIKRDKPAGAYISYGATYHLFLMKFKGDAWETQINNGVRYEVLVITDVKQYINKVGFNAMGGIQINISNNIFIDMYGGLGLKYSFYNSNVPTIRHFNNSYSGFGFTGPVFVFGLKIGALLPPTENK